MSANMDQLMVEIENNRLNSIAYAAERAEKAKAKVEATSQFLEKLKAESNIDFSDNFKYLYHYTDARAIQLPSKAANIWRAIRQVVGDLEQQKVVPATSDLRKKLVHVYLQPKAEKYQHLSFYFEKKLAKSAKCKLVRKKSTYVTMECDTIK